MKSILSYVCQYPYSSDGGHEEHFIFIDSLKRYRAYVQDMLGNSLCGLLSINKAEIADEKAFENNIYAIAKTIDLQLDYIDKNTASDYFDKADFFALDIDIITFIDAIIDVLSDRNNLKTTSDKKYIGFSDDIENIIAKAVLHCEYFSDAPIKEIPIIEKYTAKNSRPGFFGTVVPFDEDIPIF